jgi:hypothetical protein
MRDIQYVDSTARVSARDFLRRRGVLKSAGIANAMTISYSLHLFDIFQMRSTTVAGLRVTLANYGRTANLEAWWLGGVHESMHDSLGCTIGCLA